MSNLFINTQASPLVDMPVKRMIRWVHSGYYGVASYVSQNGRSSILMYRYLAPWDASREEVRKLALKEGYQYYERLEVRPKNADRFSFII